MSHQSIFFLVKVYDSSIRFICLIPRAPIGTFWSPVGIAGSMYLLPIDRFDSLLANRTQFIIDDARALRKVILFYSPVVIPSNISPTKFVYERWYWSGLYCRRWCLGKFRCCQNFFEVLWRCWSVVNKLSRSWGRNITDMIEFYYFFLVKVYDSSIRF